MRQDVIHRFFSIHAGPDSVSRTFNLIRDLTLLMPGANQDQEVKGRTLLHTTQHLTPLTFI
jgi:hypothetical protein